MEPRCIAASRSAAAIPAPQRASLRRGGKPAAVPGAPFRSRTGMFGRDLTCQALSWPSFSLGNSREAYPAPHSSPREANMLSELRRFMESRGCYIHPDIIISHQTTTGCRGLVARQDIEDTRALMLFPSTAFVDTAEASDKLAADGFDAAHLDDVELLALYLAHERARQNDSELRPWLALLPAVPPGAFSDVGASAFACLTDPPVRGVSREKWASELKEHRARTEARVARMAAAGATDAGLSRQDLQWGLGMVASRAFVAGDRVVLVPFLDMCNHSASPHEHCDVAYGPDEALIQGRELELTALGSLHRVKSPLRARPASEDGLSTTDEEREERATAAARTEAARAPRSPGPSMPTATLEDAWQDYASRHGVLAEDVLAVRPPRAGPPGWGVMGAFQGPGALGWGIGAGEELLIDYRHECGTPEMTAEDVRVRRMLDAGF
ncbi:unnamed protein product [Pedinophyceae sp. YPF-701]|nr:unnamed protein product [Pedinophyceae sp. YPF-701]